MKKTLGIGLVLALILTFVTGAIAFSQGNGNSGYSSREGYSDWQGYDNRGYNNPQGYGNWRDNGSSQGYGNWNGDQNRQGMGNTWGNYMGAGHMGPRMMGYGRCW